MSGKSVVKNLKDLEVSPELKIFNDIKMLNWAWIHETEDGSWK